MPKHKNRVSKSDSFPAANTADRFIPQRVAMQDELITACEKGQIFLVETLISRGANLNCFNSQGKLPLGAAIWGCNPELVKFILTKLPNLDYEYWQMCVDINQRLYGSLVPVIKPFLACCERFGDLYNTYLSFGGEGFAMYSDWYWILNGSQSWWLEAMEKVGRAGTELSFRGYEQHFLDSSDQTQADLKLSHEFFTRYYNYRRYTQGASDKITIIAAQHDSYNNITNAMKCFVQEKLSQKHQKSKQMITAKKHEVEIVDPSLAFFSTQWSKVLSEDQNRLQNELFLGCYAGQVEAVKTSISNGADLCIADSQGLLPLGAAIWGCNPELVRFIEAQMPNLNAKVWQQCIETNRRVFGDLTLKLESFTDCVKTVGDLCRAYTGHLKYVGRQTDSGRGVDLPFKGGFGMYSSWYWEANGCISGWIIDCISQIKNFALASLGPRGQHSRGNPKIVDCNGVEHELASQTCNYARIKLRSPDGADTINKIFSWDRDTISEGEMKTIWQTQHDGFAQVIKQIRHLVEARAFPNSSMLTQAQAGFANTISAVQQSTVHPAITTTATLVTSSAAAPTTTTTSVLTALSDAENEMASFSGMKSMDIQVAKDSASAKSIATSHTAVLGQKRTRKGEKDNAEQSFKKASPSL